MISHLSRNTGRMVGKLVPTQMPLLFPSVIAVKRSGIHSVQVRRHGEHKSVEPAHGHSHGTSLKDLLFHSHSHSHGQPEVEDFQMSPEMQEKEMRITRWGLYSNILLTIGKFIAGIVGNSSALIADGVHSVSDMLSDAVTMLTIKHSSLPADREHPYGHGKIEDLGTGVIAGVLVLTGLGIGWSAVDSIMDIVHLHTHAHDHALDPAVQNTIDAFKQSGMTAADAVVAANGTAAESSSWLSRMQHLFAEGLAHGHSHGHGVDAHTPTSLALSVAVASVLVKEALFHMTMQVARSTNSKIVEVNAWHHRSDALSSLIAVVGVAGAMMHVPVLDPLAAFVVAGLITKQGWDMGREVFRAITDHDVEAEVKAGVEASLRKCAYYGLVGYHGLRGRKMGRYSVLDVNVVVPPTLSVSAAHQVAETVRQQVLADNSGVSQIHVHVDVDGDLDAAEVCAVPPSGTGVGGVRHGHARANCSECGDVSNRAGKVREGDAHGAVHGHGHGVVHGHVNVAASHEHAQHHTHTHTHAHAVGGGVDDGVVYVDEVVVDASNVDHVNACVSELNRRLNARVHAVRKAENGHAYAATTDAASPGGLVAPAREAMVGLAGLGCAPGHARLMRSVLAIEFDVKRIVARPKYAHGLRICVHSITPHYVHGHLTVDVEVALGCYCSSDECASPAAAEKAAAEKAAPDAAVAPNTPAPVCGSCGGCNSARATPCATPAIPTDGPDASSPGVACTLDDMFAVAAALKRDIERGVPDIECANLILRLTK